MKSFGESRLKTGVWGFLVILVLLGLYQAWGKGLDEVYSYSLIPPVLAIFLAFFTKRLALSLGLAVVSASVLVGARDNTSVITFFSKSVSELIRLFTGAAGVGYSEGLTPSSFDSTNIRILLFVFLILGMISVISLIGGFEGVVRAIKDKAKDARSTKFAAYFLGLAVFIDDYANTMVVGNTMRPLADRYKISREKLAFIVDSTSAPVSGVAFISTWIGYEVGLFTGISKTLNLEMDGYSIFLEALPYRFYCFFMLIFVFFNIFLKRDYGPMFHAEHRAESTGELTGKNAKPMTSKNFSSSETDKGAKITYWSALLPVIVLFGYLFVFLWKDGGGFNREFSFDLTLFREVISGAENNITIIAEAAGFGLFVAFLCGVLIAKVNLQKIVSATILGMRSALLPSLILILAWSMKSSCDTLKTGEFLLEILSDKVSIVLFPLLTFTVSGLIAFSTGTSWGTMAILIPTVTPLAVHLDGGQMGLVTIMSLASILDGAIFGDHCSPVSDTTLMSSIASSCDHLHHVKTQLPYALTVAALALVLGYFLTALGLSAWISFLAALIVIPVIFFAFGKDPRSV